MASIAGLYGGYTANQEDGSGGRNSFFRGFRSAGVTGGGDKSKDQRGAGGIDLQGAIKTNTYLTDEWVHAYYPQK